MTNASFRRRCCVSSSTSRYRDPSVVVRSQLACTAKRLPASETIPIVEQLLRHDEDADDVQMPLLIWWAIEDKAISDTDRVLQLVQAGDLWHRPLMTRFIIERLARRFLSEGTNASAAACAILLRHAQQERTVDLVLTGMLQALAGQKRDEFPSRWKAAVNEIVRHESANPRAIELALQTELAGRAPTRPFRLRPAARHPRPIGSRSSRRSANRKTPAAVAGLLSLLTDDSPEPIKIAALSALGYFSDDHIADAILASFSTLSPQSQARSIELLCQPPELGPETGSSRSIAKRSRRHGLARARPAPAPIRRSSG